MFYFQGTWEPEENLEGSTNLIEQFEKEKKEKREKNKEQKKKDNGATTPTCKRIRTNDHCVCGI